MIEHLWYKLDFVKGDIGELTPERCAINREADTVKTLAPSSPMPWRTRTANVMPHLMQGCAVNSRIHMLSSLTLTCL
jgi:hypothetical protein